jgi:hypothetical protein
MKITKPILTKIIREEILEEMIRQKASKNKETILQRAMTEAKVAEKQYFKTIKIFDQLERFTPTPVINEANDREEDLLEIFKRLSDEEKQQLLTALDEASEAGKNMKEITDSIKSDGEKGIREKLDDIFVNVRIFFNTVKVWGALGLIGWVGKQLYDSGLVGMISKALSGLISFAKKIPGLSWLAEKLLDMSTKYVLPAATKLAGWIGGLSWSAIKAGIIAFSNSHPFLAAGVAVVMFSWIGAMVVKVLRLLTRPTKEAEFFDFIRGPIAFMKWCYQKTFGEEKEIKENLLEHCLTFHLSPA